MSSPIELACALARAKPTHVEALKGGRNNQVYKVEFEDQGPAVLKIYFTDDRDTRDRLGAEWAFLTLAEKKGIAVTPRPLACDPELRCALLSHISGRKLEPEDVRSEHVAQATDFLIALNTEPDDVSGLKTTSPTLAPASEACFSLEQHVATIDRRVSRLSTHVSTGPLATDMSRFVQETLAPAWASVREELWRRAAEQGWNEKRELSSHEQWVSPSDFGFHNALCDDGRLRFLDFEYAGRDDPAKLICDFFRQPDIPAPESYLPAVLSRLAAAGMCDENLKARVDILMNAYRIKWVCILLNEFLSDGMARRAFAEGAAVEDVRARQLTKARSAMAALVATLSLP